MTRGDFYIGFSATVLVVAVMAVTAFIRPGLTVAMGCGIAVVIFGVFNGLCYAMWREFHEGELK